MPVSQTNERALEECIERSLIEASRYEKGNPADFDREFAVDREQFWRFLETTQPEELEKLRDRPNWQRLILERLDRKIKKDGILSVLKKGLFIDDAHLTLLYSLPYNDANPAIQANFERNLFSVTRQVHYSESDPGLSIDLVLFLNGIAIATLELKNPWTNQTVYLFSRNAPSACAVGMDSDGAVAPISQKSSQNHPLFCRTFESVER